MAKKKPSKQPDQRVTIGHNSDVGHVVMIFGDPEGPTPFFVTFEPGQAEQTGWMLIEHSKQVQDERARKFLGTAAASATTEKHIVTSSRRVN